ncbi:hypothetical protein [Streptomyces sp. DW26H14]|uniref:hypothetical protein n=1 Tax=Streptomyces sp. DW26H14 TaxID=3435395 RepID=UPI00403DC45A
MRVRHRRTAALTTAVLIAAGFTAAQETRTPRWTEAFAPARGAGQGRAAEPVHPSARSDGPTRSDSSDGPNRSDSSNRSGTAVLAGPAGPTGPAGPATCRIQVTGSHVIAYCHNPDPATDRVRLHVECARWWDIDADSAPADIPAAGYARIAERCWKEIASVWVSHEPVRSAPAPQASPGRVPETRAPVTRASAPPPAGS